MNENEKKLIDKLQKLCEENRQMLKNIFGIVMLIFFKLDKMQEDGCNENLNTKQMNNESITSTKDEFKGETSKVEKKSGKSENDAEVERTCDVQILENTPTSDESPIRGTKRRAQSTEEDSETEGLHKKFKNDEFEEKKTESVTVKIENPPTIDHDGSVMGVRSLTLSGDAKEDKIRKLQEREWRIELAKREDRKYNIVLKGLWGDASDRRRQARRILSEILGRKLEPWEMRDNYGFRGQPYLIVRLRNQEETDKVMSKRERMKERNVVEVMHDLTAWQRKGRRMLQPIAGMERTEGKIVTVENDKLWVNGVQSQWRKNQWDLPEEEMERKKREKRKGEAELKSMLDKRIDEIENLIEKLKERENKLVDELVERETASKTRRGSREQEKKKRDNDINNNKQTFK